MQISQQLDIIQNMVTNLNADFKRQTNLLLGVGDLDALVEIPNLAGLAGQFIAPAFAEVAAPRSRRRRSARSASTTPTRPSGP